MQLHKRLVYHFPYGYIVTGICIGLITSTAIAWTQSLMADWCSTWGLSIDSNTIVAGGTFEDRSVRICYSRGTNRRIQSVLYCPIREQNPQSQALESNSQTPGPGDIPEHTALPSRFSGRTEPRFIAVKSFGWPFLSHKMCLLSPTPYGDFSTAFAIPIDTVLADWPASVRYDGSISIVHDEADPLKAPTISSNTGLNAPQRVERGLPYLLNLRATLANTVVLGFIPLLLFQILRRLKQRIRIGQHRCVHCGYPKSGSTACPECGPSTDSHSDW